MEQRIRLPQIWIASGWKIIKKIGEGSYGTVYEIERNIDGLKEHSALKIIPIPRSQDEIMSARYYGYDDQSLKRRYDEDLHRILSEYQIMMNLKGNSNVVSCEDIYKEKISDGIGWNVYIRMEYLTPFLKYRMNHDFGEPEIRKLAIDMCKALMLCEQKNIVHRDIKPENIMVSDSGNFKLGDFGIARIMEQAATATNAGTKPYTAPEVIKGNKYDQRVDIYSLGLVLYWLINDLRLPFLPDNGQPPSADEAWEAYEKRINGDPLPRPANGSEYLQDIVLKACSYLPDERYSDAEEMLNDLQKDSGKLNNFFAFQKKTESVNTSSNTETSWNDDTSTIGVSWETAAQTDFQRQPSAVLENADTGDISVIDKESFTIGKLRDSSDLFIASHTVSRRHALIKHKGSKYFLSDLNSLNHTYLNGKRLIPEKEYLLSDGDEICFDDRKFIFKLK